MTLSHTFNLSRRVLAGLLWGGVVACPSKTLSGEPSVVSATAADSNTGEVWIGTWGEGLYRRSAGRLDNFDQLSSGLAGNIIFDVVFAGGRVWAATNGGVSVYDPISREWELHFARRGDARDVAIVDLAYVEPFVTARTWKGPTMQFDLRSRLWHEIEDSPAEGTRHDLSSCFATAPQSQPKGPPALALFLRAHRTITLPNSNHVIKTANNRPNHLAVQLAVEQQNKIREHQNLAQFDLLVPTPGYASYGWGLPEDEFIGFARNADVLGVVARIGPDEAITDAVVARTGLPVVNVAGQEQDGNPWVFQCAGDEPRRWRRVLDWLRDEFGAARFAAVVGPDEASRRQVDWWIDHLEKRGLSWVGELEWDQREESEDRTVQSLKRMEAAAVLSTLNGTASAEFLRRMRAQGIEADWVGTEELVSEEFAKNVGPEAGPIVALLREEPAELSEFAKAYAEGEKHAPDKEAIAAFWATNHLLAAMETDQPSRVKVRKGLREMRRSSMGELHYETLVPARSVGIAVFTGGRWIRRELPP